ncbi:MAG: hypothetical protein V4608_16600 [Bacteroidota bacterium]
MRRGLAVSIFLLFTLFSLNTAFATGENNDNVDQTSIIIARINNEDIEVSIPTVIFTFADTDIKLKFKKPEHTRLLYNNNKISFIINGEEKQLNFVNGEANFKKQFNFSDKVLTIFTEEFSYTHKITAFPIWAIIIPVLLVIGLVIFLMMKRSSKKLSEARKKEQATANAL